MLLIDRVGQRQTVAACCADAEMAGVRVGMPAAQARALFDVGGVRLVPSDAARDGRSLCRLAVWAERFSPLVEVDAPDGLLLDVTGCARVFGSERGLVERVVAAFAGLGVGCRVVIAPTFAGAWALARFGKEDAGVVGDVGALRDLLQPLPIAGLGADDATVAALGELGIVRIGDVLELPRSCLPARFGEELLLRLDRALGRALETIDPVRVMEEIAEHVAFDGPTPRVEAIELAAGELLERVCDRLRGQERGARHVEIVLERSDLEPVAVELVLSRPSRDAGHLFRLARPRLEGVHLGFGVEGVAVRVRASARVSHEQAGGFGVERRDDADVSARLGVFVDGAVNRLGVSGVLVPRLRSSWVPERAEALVRACDARPADGAAAVGRDRPSVLFDRPEPVEVVALTPDGPVHRVRWRGEEHAVTGCVGPEHIGHEWWRACGATRGYYRARLESGLWVWLARGLETDRWFVHGVWA